MKSDWPDKRHAETMALCNSGQPERALEMIEHYLAAHPDDANGLVVRGDIHRALGAYNAAASSYEDALAYNPQHFQAHIGIADVLVQKGWEHSALIVLENARAFAGESRELRERHDAAKASIEKTAERWRANHPATSSKP